MIIHLIPSSGSGRLNVPGVYVNVENYIPWIQSVAGASSSSTTDKRLQSLNNAKNKTDDHGKGAMTAKKATKSAENLSSTKTTSTTKGSFTVKKDEVKGASSSIKPVSTVKSAALVGKGITTTIKGTTSSVKGATSTVKGVSTTAKGITPNPTKLTMTTVKTNTNSTTKKH